MLWKKKRKKRQYKRTCRVFLKTCRIFLKTCRVFWTISKQKQIKTAGLGQDFGTDSLCWFISLNDGW